jgi:Ca-activated chloride channel homolog
MKNLKLVSLVLLMLISLGSLAQEKMVSGVVTEGGMPLPGVGVIIKGTSTGTETDFNGKYSIKVKIGQELEFTYIGMKKQTIKVGTSNVINVKMVDDNQVLQEVLVTGYGRNIRSSKLEKRVVKSRGYVNPNKGKNEKTKKIANDKISNEAYDIFEENTFESPKAAPLSNFSIDVDNASYTNIRRFINNGQQVPKDAVRIEEMINFFKYNNPKPTNEHPFAIATNYTNCPWNENHKLLRIGLHGKDIEDKNLPASNLVFLIDVSGSMGDENKLPLLKKALRVLIQNLKEEDKISIVVYAGAAGMVLEPTSGKNQQKVIEALENLNAGGSTAGGAGIELAYKIAAENFIKNGNNRVILATDGDFNVGNTSDKDMETLIEEKRKTGVFLTCLGFGMGNYKDSKMETLANKGNGNFAYIDTMQEANRFLGKEFKGNMFAIAKDVKIQIEFNPLHVQNYRLIGYENRKLNDEDFIDDTKDAGELGSGHQVTALYEIIPTGVKSEFSKELPELKYSEKKPKIDFGNELATIKFRYKKPDGNKSIEMTEVIENQLDANENENCNFAASVAWFGLCLRDSKFIANKNLQEIIALAQKSKTYDTEGYKAEFIRLIESYRSNLPVKNGK